jgi:hypothetical protein
VHEARVNDNPGFECELSPRKYRSSFRALLE